jgi:hypothetical protein
MGSCAAGQRLFVERPDRGSIVTQDLRVKSARRVGIRGAQVQACEFHHDVASSHNVLSAARGRGEPLDRRRDRFARLIAEIEERRLARWILSRCFY